MATIVDNRIRFTPEQLWRALEIGQRAREARAQKDQEYTIEEEHVIAEDADALTMLDSLLRNAAFNSRMEKSAAEAINDLKARRDRYKERAKADHNDAYEIMAALGIQKRHLPDLTAYFQKGRTKVDVPDVNKLPDQYCRITREPNLTLLCEELEQGVIIEGAELVQSPPFLTVRTR